MPPGTDTARPGLDGFATGSPGGSFQDRGGPRVRAGDGDVADLELERLEAAEGAARQPCHDVEPVALADGLGEVGPAERDAVEDVPVGGLSTSCVWPPLAARTRPTVSPRTATSGSGLPVPHGARRASSRKSS